MRSAHRKLQRLDIGTMRYTMPCMVYLALVTGAGLLITCVAFSEFGDQLKPELIRLILLVGYVACDLIRLRFPRGVTISLGFPVILLILLTESAVMALTIAILGSLASEVLRSVFSRGWLHLFLSLPRILFYAGHHAVSCLGALVAYQLVSSRFSPWLGLDRIHIQATLAYVTAYSLTSMGLVWPHDRQIHLLLAPNEERLVRIDLVTTLLLLPIPASVLYLYDSLNLGPMLRMLVVVGILPLLFTALFLVARGFTKVSEEQERLTLREKISQHLGSANMAEMAERMLEIAEQLVSYRWGAVYILVDKKLELSRYGVKPRKGKVNFCDPKGSEKTPTPNVDTSTDQDTVIWPAQFRPGDGILGHLAGEGLHARFFYHGLAVNIPTELHLPRKTALIVFPITVTPQQEKKETPRMIGLVALARPRRWFTIQDQELGQALVGQAVNLLLSFQNQERRVREILQELRNHTRDLDQVYHAMQGLAARRVKIDSVLEAISNYVLRRNLRTVLRSVIDGGGSNRISITQDRLAEIYEQVRIRTAEPTMPPPDQELLDLLQKITSSLSPSLGFHYQSAGVAQAPFLRTFCEFGLYALEARTVPDIVAQGPTLERLANDLKIQSPDEYRRISEQLDQLQQIVSLLQRTEDADTDVRMTCLNEASRLLSVTRDSAQYELEGPELFSLAQVAITWQTAVCNALYAAEEMKAELAMALENTLAAPLRGKVAVQLRLENRGPATAFRLAVEIQSSQDYQIKGDERVEVGDLPTARVREIEFKVEPERGRDTIYPKFSITYEDRKRQVSRKFCDRVHLREDSTPFTKIGKVYTVGPSLGRGSDLFFGRENIFEFIEDSINAPTTTRPVLLLIGTRRMGKTSILKQLPERLQDRAYIPVFVDCQRIVSSGIEGFLWQLCNAISEGLKLINLSIECPSLADLKHQPEFVFEKEFLPKVWERIGDRALLIAIDEPEALCDLIQSGRLEPGTFTYLRSLIQSQEKIAFVIAGTPHMEEQIARYESAFFNMTKSRRISFLKREEAVRLVTEPVKPYSMVYDELVLDEILRLTACHPYFLQLVCDCLVDHCNETKRSYVTNQDVWDVQNSILERGGGHFGFIWRNSSYAEKAVLSALVSLLHTQGQVTASNIVEHLKDRIGDLMDGG